MYKTHEKKTFLNHTLMINNTFRKSNSFLSVLAFIIQNMILFCSSFRKKSIKQNLLKWHTLTWEKKISEFGSSCRKINEFMLFIYFFQKYRNCTNVSYCGGLERKTKSYREMGIGWLRSDRRRVDFLSTFMNVYRNIMLFFLSVTYTLLS